MEILIGIYGMIMLIIGTFVCILLAYVIFKSFNHD